MSDSDQQLVDLTRPSPPTVYLAEVWRRRDFAILVPVQDLRAQNMGSALGQLWHLLNPALMVAVYFLIFGVIIDTSRGVDNFLGFLIVGVVWFHLTQRVVQDAAVCIPRNLGLIRSVQFPRILLPAATVNGQTAAFAPALVLALAAVIATGERPSLRWLALIGVLAAQFVFNFGAALLVARIGAAVPDLRQLLPHVFRLLFYASGVIFSVDAFVTSEFWRRAFALNPIYDVITCARWCLLGEPVDSWVVAGMLAWGVVLLVVGFAVFWRSDQRLGA
ncbi:MAG: ABC transporter permease [Acidimicrobiaceae bacterium]|nr:ABC transporter permease [Acidimicrobiaceae bacterium]MYE09405.1 ABC transporter permease [Acidimicrobiaceae bacterium]MYI36539.1 ABC transporter permease [Acidimicrobiaceae bacterium]